MAKKMRAETLRAKLKDNRVGILKCQLPGCDCEFYTKHPDKPRMCAMHSKQAGIKVEKTNLLAELFSLGILS